MINVSRYGWLQNTQGTINNAYGSGILGRDADEIIRMEHGFLQRLVSGINDHCDVPCGSICCYFNTPYSSAFISRRDLTTLSKAGLKDQSRYCTYVPLRALKEEARKNIQTNPLFLHKVGGELMACMLNTKNTLVSSQFLTHKPLMFEQGKPLWPSENAQACAFLDSTGKCGLYLKGLEIEVCRGFICSAHFTLKVIESFGLSQLQPRTLEDVNVAYRRIDEAVAQEGIAPLERGYDNAFRDAVLKTIKRKKTDYRKIKKRAVSLREKIKRLVELCLTT